MFRTLLCALALVSTYSLSNASTVADLGTANCSGDMDYSLNEVANYICAGDIFLGGGSIFSDSKIAISADGTINLEGLTLTAPAIDLMSQEGTISFGSNVSINTNKLNVYAGNGGSPTISSLPGSTLTIGLDGVSRVIPLGDISLTLATGGSISLGSGDISLVTTVPLPASCLLFCSGFAALFSLTTFGKRAYAWNNRGI